MAIDVSVLIYGNPWIFGLYFYKLMDYVAVSWQYNFLERSTSTNNFSLKLSFGIYFSNAGIYLQEEDNKRLAVSPDKSQKDSLPLTPSTWPEQNSL